MQAKDIMTKTVATVPPEATVQDIAKLLLARRISAVPVVDAGGKVVGIVSEGDLMRRPESGTERPTVLVVDAAGQFPGAGTRIRAIAWRHRR